SRIVPRSKPRTANSRSSTSTSKSTMALPSPQRWWRFMLPFYEARSVEGGLVVAGRRAERPPDGVLHVAVEAADAAVRHGNVQNGMRPLRAILHTAERLRLDQKVARWAGHPAVEDRLAVVQAVPAEDHVRHLFGVENGAVEPVRDAALQFGVPVEVRP